MQPISRLALFLPVVAPALLLASPAARAEFDAVRESPALYTCETADGEEISRHNTDYRAIIDCGRLVDQDGVDRYIQPARIRLFKIDKPEPEPQPQPEPEPEPEPPAEPEPPPEPQPIPTEIPEPFAWQDQPDCPAPDMSDPDWAKVSATDCTIRNVKITGRSLDLIGANIAIDLVEVDGQARSSKVGIRLTGENFVIHNSSAHDTMGNDKHCISGRANNVWIIGFHGYRCSGDGVQFGHKAQSSPPTNIYILNSRFEGNRENAIDMKWVRNVIIADNEIGPHKSANQTDPWCLTDPDGVERCSSQNSGSDGTAILIGSDGGPTGWAVLRNRVTGAVNCIRVEAAYSEGIIRGNTCIDLPGTALVLEKQSGRILFADNVVQRAARGIHQNWRENFALDVIGNTFEDLAGPAIEYESANVASASTLTDNTFRRTGGVRYKGQAGGAVLTTAEQINALPGASGNRVE